MPDPRPPVPGPIVQPNFLSVEEAVGDITFPISKKDLLDQLTEDASALVAGRNMDLHEMIKDLHDDFFDSEDEFREALEREYAGRLHEDADTPGVLPTGPAESWAARTGDAETAGPSSVVEPQE